jgi:hypothetical protein
MSNWPSPRRRWFIGVAASSVIALRWNRGTAPAIQTENAFERARKKLVLLLHEPERARKVGSVYLRSAARQQAPPRELVETVLSKLGPDAGDEAMRRFIVARIRGELRDAQVISVDGWIMSPTEARLCGLAAARATL